MKLQPYARTALALAMAALVAACGGADAPQVSAQDFQQRIAASVQRADARHPLAAQSNRPSAPTSLVGAAAAAAAISNDQLFTWAQKTFPQYFGSAAPQRFEIAYGGKTFDVAGYSTGNYIGVANGVAHILGPMTGGALVTLDPISNYVSLVCSSIDCGAPPLPAGGLNECVPSNYATPPAGFRAHLVYTLSGTVSLEQTVDIVADGTATFEGQSAQQMTVSTSGTLSFGGFSVPNTSVSKNYTQVGTNGVPRELGSVIDTTQGGLSVSGVKLPDTTLSSKVVFTPPLEQSEYTLSEGQTMTITSTSRTTILANSNPAPAPGTVTTSSSTETYTFERKESVSVPAGTFNACRYKVSSGGEISTNWIIVGKGVLAKSESTVQGALQKMELKSGTFNGGPL